MARPRPSTGPQVFTGLDLPAIDNCEYDVALCEPFRLSVREIDAGTLAKLQTEWCLFLAPPEIGRAATALYERRRDLDTSKLLACTAALE